MLLAIGSALAAAITAFVGAGAAIGTTILKNNANSESVEDTNATNLQIARETNAANAEQANLAYARSLPQAQVSQMIAAGMSKGAALNKLSGGGTYTPAPQVTGAPMIPKNFDSSELSAFFDRLGNIPANIQQQKLVDEQIDAIQTDIELKRNADLRAAEEHESKQTNELYSRAEQRSYDELSNALDAALYEKGMSYDDIKSMNDIRELIGDTAAWKNRKGNSVTRLFNDATTNRGQIRSETAADDSHKISLAQLREYVDKHKISVKNLEQLNNQLNQWYSESDVRQKELNLRSLLADFNIDQAQIKKALAQAETIGILTKNADGSYSLKEGAALSAKYERYGSQLGSSARAFWTLVMDLFGLTSASDLLKGLVSVAAAG